MTNQFIRTLVTEELSKPEKAKRYKHLIDYEIDSDNSHIKFIRTKLNYGLPLNINGVKYANEYDRRDEQIDLLYKYQKKINEEWNLVYRDELEFAM